jgi:aerotaxis receptor
MRSNTPVTQQDYSFSNDANILSTTHLDSAIKYVNDDFVEISGFEREELLNQPHNMIRHPDMPSAAFETMWSRLKSGESWMGLVKNRRKNGDHYWVDAYATPIKSNGKTTEYQSVRVKPKKLWVHRAEELYQHLKVGGTAKKQLAQGFSFSQKLYSTALVLLVITLAVNVLLDNSITAMLICAFGLVGLAICSSILHRPIAALAELSKEYQDDPLARHIYTGRQDEAGQIQLLVKSLQSEPIAMAGRVNDYAEQLAKSMSAMRQGQRTAMSDISKQQAETDMVATAVEELSTSIKDVATNAQSTAEAAEHAQETVKRGSDLVGSTVNSIQSLSGEIEAAAQRVEKLANESTNIGAVVDVIKSIAEQTNLLALNAAIEAARAGEQGRGFAVVADEVRTLATRTHQSTEEIMQMMTVLQAEAHHSTDAMKKARDGAINSVESAEHAESTMLEISQSVEEINDMNMQIATAVGQQHTVAHEVSGNLSKTKMLADEVYEEAQSSTKACEQVADLSNQLKALANQYWENKKDLV